MALRFPHTSRSSHIPSMLPSVAAAWFWLVVVFWSANWRPINATKYFIFIIFALLHSTSQTMGQRFPMRFAPCVPPLQIPFHHLCRHLVGCCVFLLGFDHLRPRPRPLLYFLMGYVLGFQTKEPAVALPNRPRATSMGPYEAVTPCVGGASVLPMKGQGTAAGGQGGGFSCWLLCVLCCCVSSSGPYF